MTRYSTVNTPRKSHPTSLKNLLKSLFLNRQLILQMTKRDIAIRYKSSVMGMAWTFINPILMLIIYTFVFSVIFKSRWGNSDSKTLFAVALFAGMIVLGLFSEVVNRSPSLIITNINYVKKVVFPIEILPIIALGTALFNCLISLGVLLVASVLLNGYLNWTVIFIPLIFFPLVMVILGIAWILAALGVFLRDIGYAVGIITTLLMFLSPVFYPLDAVPHWFRPFIMANPLSFIIEQTRGVVVWGHMPDWIGLGIYTLFATLVTWSGYALFQKTRKGFADVL